MSRYYYISPLYILILLFITNIITAQYYCTPATTYAPSVRNTYIDRVRLQDIDYQDAVTPTDTCYNDYTQEYHGQTLLTRGSSYTITINGGPYVTYMYYAAWIDYNNNKDFSDADEKLGQFKTTAANQEFTFSFTVPVTASIATTRLRVRCIYSSLSRVYADPCVNYSYGEAEDYVISISDFQKIAAGISGISAGKLAFFNKDTDADYDLIMHNENTFSEPYVPLTFYDNTAGTFIPTDFINGDLPELNNDNLTFNICDLNNDNQLDFLFNYRYSSSSPRTVYFQRTGSQLSLVNTGIPDLMRGYSAAADLNNDGRQDIIVCGQAIDNDPYTYIYMNTASGFILVNDNLKGVYGQVLTADYDNDRDIDIFISGNDKYSNTNSIIYRNDNNWKFTNINANLKKIGWLESSEFGDFNNDKLPDLIVGGVIYRNNGNNTFEQIYLESEDGLNDAGHWKDIDNDGNLELISQDIWGITIHEYNGVDSFLLDQQLFSSGDNLAIGDYNNDGKQDIIINGSQAYIFKNQTSLSNSIPTAPQATSVSIGDSGFYSVTMKWSAGFDAQTPKKGLTYNLRVGTTPTGNNIFSSMTSSATNNPLLKPGMGNVNDTSWFLLNLSPGTYYFSVQTVDNSGTASAFSTPRSFTILQPMTSTSVLLPGRINQSAAGADFDGDMDIDLIIKDVVLTIHRQTSPYTYSSIPLRANCELLGINDLNNDNLPDIIIKHKKQGAELSDSLELFINLGNMNFRTLKIDTMSLSSVASADFDNDGDIDILAYDQGYFVYENTGNLKFTRSQLPFPEIMYTVSLSAIDIDRDGDFDFLSSGKGTNSFSASKCYTSVYKNSGDMKFSLFQTILPGIGPSSFTIDAGSIATNPADINWNDFNFDGYPDLLITGDDEYTNNTNQIFLNDGTGKLVTTNLSPRPADRYSSTWIDFNTDGYLDIIMPRVGYDIDNSIYLNNNNTGFEGFGNAVDNVAFAAFIKAIDVDNDKDKDILCTNKVDLTVGFNTETTIFTNNNNFINQAPKPPSTLSSEIDSFTVILNWNKGWDKLTLNEGVTYNIWVGTASNKADKVSPMADLTKGYRYVEGLGNVGTNTSWTLENLPLGKYYWSVQTIDNSLTGSAWAPVQTFELSSLTALFDNDIVCLGFDTRLNDRSVSTSPIDSWYWDFGDGTYSSAQNPSHRFTKAGNNPVKLVVRSGVAIDSITNNVFVKPIPDVKFSTNVVCTGAATAFTNSSNLNGLTIIKWTWNFGDVGSDSDLQNPGTHGYLNPGTYFATLSALADNGCSDTIKNSVIIGAIPTAAITSSGSPTFCSGDSITLSNLFIDTYIYKWQTSGLDITNADKSVYVARKTGSYTVSVTNPVGNCNSVSAPVNILVNDVPLSPEITYSTSKEFCDGDSVVLNVSPINDIVYQWKLNGGAVGSNSSQFVAKNAGTYNLVLKNSNGCSSLSSNDVIVTVKTRPKITAVDRSGAIQFCQGGNVTLSIPAAAEETYKWSNETGFIANATSSSYTATSSGSYQLQISNISGCSVKTTAVNVVVKPMPYKPVIESQNYQPGKCMGEDPIRLIVSQEVSGYSYQWLRNGIPLSNAASSSLDGFLEQGDYMLEADLNGCKAQSDMFSISFPDAPEKPMLYAQGPTVWYLACSNDSASKYRWYCNDKLIEGADKYFYAANRKMGKYKVSIANTKGCFTMSDVVSIPTGTTGIEDINPFAGLKIYPNPTPGMFTIEMDNQIYGELKIGILDQLGKEILNIKFEKTTEHFSSQIDLSGQPKGIYLINMFLERYLANRKVIVE